MKIKLTIVTILYFALNAYAQIFTPSAMVQGTSGNSNVGIGINSPTSKLDVLGTIKSYEPLQLGFPMGSSQLINEIGGSCGTGNKMYNRSWLFRDNASDSYWWSTRLHDGISIDGTYATPQINTRTWWERDPYDNIQSWGDGANTYLTINKGKIGIGTTAPETLLNVNVGSGGSNGIAGIRVGGLNNYSSLEFGIDGDYDGMIRSFGNNINYYAGHWKTKGAIASENHSHNWYTSKNGSSDWSSVKMILNENGNLGIGTILPDEKLTVKGKIHTQEVRVDMSGPLVPDYVFAEDYKLKSLQEVEDYIKQNKHLPEIPSASEIDKNGLMLAEMNMSLLKKIEELTLYMIEMKKENESLKNNQRNLEERIKKTERR